MFLNVLLDNIVCDLLAHSAKKVALFPQMACPKPFPYTRVFFDYSAARNTMQKLNHLRNRIAWRKRYEKVHMSFRYLTLLNLKVKLAGYFKKRALTLYISLQSVFVFGTSDTILGGMMLHKPHDSTCAMSCICPNRKTPVSISWVNVWPFLNRCLFCLGHMLESL